MGIEIMVPAEVLVVTMGWTVRSHQKIWVHELRRQRQVREWKCWRMKKRTMQRAKFEFTSSCCSEAIALRARSRSACTSGGSSPGCSLFCWLTPLLGWILREKGRCFHWESLPKRFVFVRFFPGKRQWNPKFICPRGAHRLRAGRDTQGSLSCSTDKYFLLGWKLNPTGMAEKIKASFSFSFIFNYWWVPCSTHANHLFKENYNTLCRFSKQFGQLIPSWVTLSNV